MCKTVVRSALPFFLAWHTCHCNYSHSDITCQRRHWQKTQHGHNDLWLPSVLSLAQLGKGHLSLVGRSRFPFPAKKQRLTAKASWSETTKHVYVALGSCYQCSIIVRRFSLTSLSSASHSGDPYMEVTRELTQTLFAMTNWKITAQNDVKWVTLTFKIP